MSDFRPRPRVSDYGYFRSIITRWNDNDPYGHINNAVYSSYFDSTVNDFLIREGGLDIKGSEAIGLVVESRCFYHAAAAYPERLRAGMRVDRLGNSSVTYGFAVFRENEDAALVNGSYVHVFVDRVTRRPRPITGRLRAALETLVVAPGN